MGSVETVTVLFTDLVGSTGLATRVGPGAAEELRREHFKLLREAVEETDGREVKNVGDGLMVVFQSSSSAVSCAVSMQQRLDRRNRRADEQLMVRIGISAGEADLEDGDYFGPPVVEASRLCNAATGGQILCGELVRMMAREGHSFRSVGTLRLKGLAEPFAAHEVEWEPLSAQAGALPLPPRLREVPPVGYVGRRAEREGLAFLLAQAREGNRRVAFVSGEPGIGKTRLATHLAVEAYGDGATVLYGRCDEDLGVPYGPWVEALRHYVSAAPLDALRAHAERHGGELARLLPDVRGRVADYPAPTETDPETERYLLFAAVAGLLEGATREAPLILILDELHWADKPSLSLLRHLVTRGGEMRLFVIGAYRDSDLTRSHPLSELLADLHREEGVSRIPLTGLEEENVVALMEAAAGHDMDLDGRRLARAIVRETDGNPFYVAELLRHLLESGAIVQGDDGRFRLEGRIEDLGLPQSVREVVGRRIERLSEANRRALSVAAVVGREFDVDLLARVLESEEDELLDLLDEAVEASVLNESGSAVGRFTFAHALINHTLYQELGRTRRARLHRRIAEAVEEACGEDPGDRLAELAHHWGQAATPDDPDKAVDYARRAGERALANLAPDEALRWFGQALELHDDRGDADRAGRCGLLIGLGEARRQAGEGDFREVLLDAARLARELGDTTLLARACLANSRGQASVHGELDAERIEMLEAALQATGSSDPALRARLLSLLNLELNWDPDFDRRQALADEALELARRSGDDQALGVALHQCGLAVQSATNAADRLALAAELRGIAERTGDPMFHFWAAWTTWITAGELVDFALADAAFEEFEARAAEIGQPSLRWSYLFGRSLRERVAGRLEEAEATAAEAAEIGEPDAFMVYTAQLAGIRWEQGQLEEMIELMEQAVEDYPGISGFRPGLAAAYCEIDQVDEARALLHAELERGLNRIGHDQSESTTLALWADISFQIGDAAPAPELYDRLLPIRDGAVWNGAIGYNTVAHYLGGLASLLGRPDEAIEHFERTIEVQRGIPAPLWLARTLHWYGKVLLDRGTDDLERARGALSESISLASGHGLSIVERRARALLDDARVAAK